MCTSGGREPWSGNREGPPRRSRSPVGTRHVDGQGPRRVRARGRGDGAGRRPDDAREGGGLGADQVDVAGHVRARVLRDRDDVDRLLAVRHRALRNGGVPLVATPGRPADRLRTRRAQDGRAAPAGLRPDARAEVGDRDGPVRQLRRDVQQLHDTPGRGQDRRGRRARAGLPAASRGADGGHRPAAREGDGRRASGLRNARGRLLNYNRVPGLVEIREAKGETTLVVDTPRLPESARYLRDELGFDFLSDIAAADYLGWGGRGVSGYIGTPGGRDLNETSTQGFQRLPTPKPRRFSVSYHLLALRAGGERVRLQVWVDDGDEVPTVVPVWPTADWHEREAWDLFGIEFSGHPNQERILMPEDWEGHPLRKDYPIGGEPVRFSGEE